LSVVSSQGLISVSSTLEAKHFVSLRKTLFFA
jgi:hypothetical protein